MNVKKTHTPLLIQCENACFSWSYFISLARVFSSAFHCQQTKKIQLNQGNLGGPVLENKVIQFLIWTKSNLLCWKNTALMIFKLNRSHVSLGHHFRSAFVFIFEKGQQFHPQTLNSKEDVELFKGQVAMSTQNPCVEAWGQIWGFLSWAHWF